MLIEQFRNSTVLASGPIPGRVHRIIQPLLPRLNPMLFKLGFGVRYVRDTTEEYVGGLIYRHAGDARWEFVRRKAG